MRAAWGRPNACVSEWNKLRVRGFMQGLRCPDCDKPVPSLPPHWLQLAPALDACLRRYKWLDQQAQISASAPTSLSSCAVESQPGIFFPPGTCAEFSLQGKDCFSLHGQLCVCLPLSPSTTLHASPVLRPQGAHFSLQTYPSLIKSPGPSLWTWDSNWQ